MPLDRADAVVIGAGVEGLSAALGLALTGKRVVCADRRHSVSDLASPDESWVSPSAARTLGLFRHGLCLTSAAPQLSRSGNDWRVLWPDAERTARTLPAAASGEFLETIAALRRWRSALTEPGMAARAMLTRFDLTRQDSGDMQSMSAFLRTSAREFLLDWLSDPLLGGMLLAMAARRTPADPAAAASAPMLLGVAPFFDDEPTAPRPVAGGQFRLVAALAAAFKEAGGVLALGNEVSEIVMERELVSGVSIGGGELVKAPLVIAATAPRRLAQGLLNTRRYGRLLSGLRGAPRRSLAMARLRLKQEPEFPNRSSGLWRAGVSVWLAATIETLQTAAHSMQARRFSDAPAIELRFSPGGVDVLALSPYCPGEHESGPWSRQGLDAVLASMLASVATHWPEAHALIESAELIAPRPHEMRGATGAIFGAAERMPELDVMLSLNGDAPAALLKGLYVCDPRGVEPDCQTGIAAAMAASNRSPVRART